MKFFSKPSNLKYLVPAAGLVGLALRAMLYRTALGSDGLLQRNHPLALILWGLTAAVMVTLWLISRKIQGPEQYQDCYRTSIPGALGCLAAAIGIFLTVLNYSPTSDRLTFLCTILGYASAGVLLVLGFCRFSGFIPNFPLPTVLCLYLCLRMILQYQSWSADPQMQNYCFQLLGNVCLMLAAYHHSAFHVEMGNHKQLWFFSLAGVYFCALSLAGPEHWLFYLTTGLWALTNLTSLTGRKRRQRTPLNLSPEEA